MNTRLDQPATPREVANAMWAIETRWPPRGKLIVQFNPEEKHEKSWFPVDFVRLHISSVSL